MLLCLYRNRPSRARCGRRNIETIQDTVRLHPKDTKSSCREIFQDQLQQFLLFVRAPVLRNALQYPTPLPRAPQLLPPLRPSFPCVGAHISASASLADILRRGDAFRLQTFFFPVLSRDQAPSFPDGQDTPQPYLLWSAAPFHLL